MAPALWVFISLALLVGEAAAFDCPGAPLNQPVNGAWPANCANATLATTCTAVCNTGFTSVPAPVISCASTGWQLNQGSPTGCSPVCLGAPPALPNGRWGSDANFNCTNSTAKGTVCQGSCNPGFIGTPIIACPNTGVWSSQSQSGNCVPEVGGCLGLPPPVVNAKQAPDSCRDGVAGQVCTYECNDNYAGVALSGLSGPVTVQSVCLNYTTQQGQQAWRWSDPDDNQLCGNTCASCQLACKGDPNDFWDVDNGALPSTTCDGTIGRGGVCFATCNPGFESSLLAWGLQPFVQCNVPPGWTGTAVSGYCNPAGSVPCNVDPTGSEQNQWTVTNSKPFPQSCLGRPNGTVCELECNANRVVSPAGSTLQSTCTIVNGTGLWSKPTATCVTPCTGAPPPLVSGYWGDASNLNCNRTIGVGSVCNGTCTGNATGNPTATCVGGTTQWQLSGFCGAPTTCPTGPAQPPVNTQGASAAQCAGTGLGQVCNVQCNDNHAPVPTPPSPGWSRTVPITCQALNTWSNSSASCQRVCPTPPPALVNGTWGSADNFNCNGTIGSGGVCTGTCNAGNTVTAECSNGLWVRVGICDAGPVCVTGPTRTPINAQDASARACAGTLIGQDCVIQCNAGNAPVPTPVPYASGVKITCLSGNIWTNATSMCRRACANPPLPTVNVTWGTLENNYCNNFTIGNGGLCTGTCTGGGSVTATCDGQNQVWLNVGSCGVGSVCPNPPRTPLNALDSSALSCAGTAVNAQCGVLCNPGHAPVPTPSPTYTRSLMLTCLPDNTWSNATAECRRVCPNPPLPLTNGTWGTPSNSYCNGTIGAGGICTGTCNGGGTVTATCLNGGTNGVWSNVGVCAAGPACTNPPTPTPTNAQTSSANACVGTLTGASCNVACNTGFASTTFGTALALTCLPTNTWSNSTGRCERACTTAPPTTVGGATVTWQAGCTAGNVGSTGRCTGTCGGGLTGSPVATCSASTTTSTWTVSGSCVAAGACTTVPPDVTNAVRATNCQGTLSGQVCTYTCNSGFNPNPTVTRACNNTAWASTAVGACVSACPVSGIPAVANVQWAPECSWLGNGRTCSGTCTGGLFGTPSLTCTFVTNTNRVYSQAGGCSSTRVCPAGTISGVTGTLNGSWKCSTTAVGQTCPITCNTGYSGTATIACQTDLTNTVTGGKWGTSFTGSMCTRTVRRMFE